MRGFRSKRSLSPTRSSLAGWCCLRFRRALLPTQWAVGCPSSCRSLCSRPGRSCICWRRELELGFGHLPLSRSSWVWAYVLFRSAGGVAGRCVAFRRRRRRPRPCLRSCAAIHWCRDARRHNVGRVSRPDRPWRAVRGSCRAASRTVRGSWRTMHDLGFTPRPLELSNIGAELREQTRVGITYGWRQPGLRLLMLSGVVRGAFSVGRSIPPSPISSACCAKTKSGWWE
jgi:hypothetical protein